MSRLDKPKQRPAIPNFSSGPCAKRPGWTPQVLSSALLGRSHRSPAGIERLRLAIDTTHALLELPADYRLAIVPGLRHGRFRDGAVVDARRARCRRARLGGFRQALGRRHRRRAEAGRHARARRPTTGICPISPASTSTATSSSPGTARQRACACRTAIGSPPTAAVSPSSMPRRRCSRRPSIGAKSMSPRSPGKRCSAAKRRTA